MIGVRLFLYAALQIQHKTQIHRKLGFIHPTVHKATFNGFNRRFQDYPDTFSSTWCGNLCVPFYCLLPGWICIFCCVLSHGTSGSCLMPKAFSTEYSRFSHFVCVLEHRVSLAKQFILFKFLCPWPPLTARGKVASGPQNQNKINPSWYCRALLLHGALQSCCSETRRMPTQFMDSLVLKYVGCQRF